MSVLEQLQKYAVPYNDTAAEYNKTRYCIVNAENDKSIILLFLPYKPYRRENSDYAYIDAFYIASNALYHTTKSLCSSLANYSATICNGDLKQLFEDTKCGIRLYNTLMAIPPYGTKITLAALSVDEKLIAEQPHFTDTCKGCKKCRAACPTGALAAGFSRDNCLRSAMDSYKTTEIDLNKLGGSMLGCDICQRVCPYNAAIETEEMPTAIKDVLRYDRLFSDIHSGKAALEDLGKLIGFNYIRPQKLTYFALNSICKAEYAHFAQDFLQSQEAAIRLKAQEIIAKFS